MKLDNIEKIVEDKIKKDGFELEYIEFVKEGNNNILRVVVDKKNSSVSIDDCEKISREIEDEIDKNIKSEYILEVSSAGLERQLKNIKLYQKYIGNNIYIKLYKKQNDKKEITGILKDVDNVNNNIIVNEDDEDVLLNIKDIAVAHTVYDFDSIFKNKDNVNINKLKKF